MTVVRNLLSLFAALALLLPAASAVAQAQPAPKEYEPRPYQEGKDVIWLPTPQSLVEKMLELAKVTPNDFVIDLGSGDGRTPITAAKKFGARAMGIEYNPDMVEFSNRAAAKEGVSAKVKFVKADLFETDFSQATVITMYLLPALNVKLRPKILDLKPGTRIVSHAFDMGEWQPDRTETHEGKTAYLWIVPAKVEGTWQLAQGELLLAQNFQTLIGTLKSGGNTVMITNGRLRGDQISFTAGNAQYTGRVKEGAIEGTVKGSSAGRWNAVRAAAKPAKTDFAPQVGQDGKDVIWVPTPEGLIERMLTMAKVTADDFVVDLGSGDGRTVIAAAKTFGARAMGVEYNPDMVELSNRNAEKAGVAGKVKFVNADLFETDFSQATVVTMYLLPVLNLKLRPTILDMKPGTRIVSHAFNMEDWQADQTESFESRTAYLWIVPAKVAGTWQVGQGELTLRQSFQVIEGTLRSGDRSTPITNGTLRGDQISFTAGDSEYSGRVNASVIEGSVKSGATTSNWTASLRRTATAPVR